MENVRLEFVKALQISVNTRRIRRQFRGIRSWINRFQLGIILQINISWKGETSQRGLKHEYIHRGNIFDRYDRPRPHETLCCNKQQIILGCMMLWPFADLKLITTCTLQLERSENILRLRYTMGLAMGIFVNILFCGTYLASGWLSLHCPCSRVNYKWNMWIHKTYIFGFTCINRFVQTRNTRLWIFIAHRDVVLFYLSIWSSGS